MEIRFTILYNPKVVRDDIPALSSVNRDRICEAIENKLMVSPEQYAKPLRRSLRGYRKLRVGDYRIIFRIQEDNIIIVGILHRSIAYEKALMRRI